MAWKIKAFNELTTTELYRILQLRCQVFIVEQECPYLDIDYLDIDANHLFLEEDDEIIAYCRLLDPGVTFQEASIGRVLVREDHRKKGLSHQMMLKAIAFHFDQKDYPSITLSGQTYLLEFYKGLGFEVVGSPYLEDNIEHIDLQLNRK
ncbi:GNAT family N-acetyltransferase [Facklamia miroungae]|uniref:ElaA protein n=1 Tax=Facklamia miroungae TaxID=120956 RepID=A0A1G7UWZ1_9LACT|nr:GNAT family N-acetyltransferase [Facklamia miroungae]NKZ30155.1 GNAT family N-acetyltransferase [Facklamia miroungae]SDG51984.1 ElaA protein [Facklamia miroungae]